MANTNKQMIVELRLKYKNYGWSERFNLLESVDTYDAALPIALALCNFRKIILPDNASITRARVSFAGRPREAKLAKTTFPIAGIAHTTLADYAAVAADCNDVETALHVRFETAQGRFVNEYIRCLPDDVVTAEAMVAPVTVVTSAPDDAPYATWYVRMAAYLYYLKANTAYNRLSTKGTDTTAPVYETSGWDGYIPVGVSNRKTGAHFSKPRGRRPVGA